MNLNRIAMAGLAALSMGFAAPSVAQDAATDAVVAGVKITKDPEIAKLLPEKYREKGIRAEVDPPYPPFLMVDDAGNFYGTEISVASAVAARLGVPITYGRVRWDASIPALQARKYDLLLGTIADTEARQEVVNIISYMTYGLALVVKGANPDGIASGKDLCGKKLAILQGWSPPDYFDSLSVSCTERGLEPVNISRLPSTPDTLLAVKSGSADATYVSTPAAIGATDDIEGMGVTIVTPEDQPGGWNPQNHGWATLKSETGLTDAIAAALNSLLKDGTVKRINDEHGIGDLVIDDVAVNQALPDVKLK